MAIPQSYKDAAAWFRSGKIGFDELLAIVRQLPPPEPFTHTDDEDLHRQCEQGPGPQSSEWLGQLRDYGLIDTNEYKQLCHAAAAA